MHRSESGFGTILGLIFTLVLLFSLAFAVDTARLQSYRTSLQSSLDAALLMGTSLIQQNELEMLDERVKAEFYRQSGSYGIPRSRIIEMEFELGGSSMGGKVAARIPHAFGSMLGAGSSVVRVATGTVTPPIYAALVLDISGSMNCPEVGPCSCDAEPPFKVPGEKEKKGCSGGVCECDPEKSKLKRLKEAAKKFVQRFRPGVDGIAVVAYNQRAELVLPFQDSGGHDISAVFSAVDSLVAGGYTNGSEGLSVAHAEFRRAAGLNLIKTITRNSILFFSDGAQTAAIMEFPEWGFGSDPSLVGRKLLVHHQLKLVERTPADLGLVPVAAVTTADAKKFGVPSLSPNKAKQMNESEIVNHWTLTHPLNNLNMYHSKFERVSSCHEIAQLNFPQDYMLVSGKGFELVDKESETLDTSGFPGMCILDLNDLQQSSCLLRSPTGQCLGRGNKTSKGKGEKLNGEGDASRDNRNSSWTRNIRSWAKLCQANWATNFLQMARKRSGYIPSIAYGPISDRSHTNEFTGPAAVVGGLNFYSTSDLHALGEEWLSSPPDDPVNLFGWRSELIRAHLANHSYGGGDGLWVSENLLREFEVAIDKIKRNLKGEERKRSYEGRFLRAAAKAFDTIILSGHTTLVDSFEAMNRSIDRLWLARGESARDSHCLVSIEVMNPDPSTHGTKFETINPDMPPGPISFYQQYHNLAIAESDYARSNGISVFSVGLGRPIHRHSYDAYDAYQSVTDTKHIKEHFLRRLALDEKANNGVHFNGVMTYEESLAESYGTQGVYEHVRAASELPEIFEHVAFRMIARLNH